MMTQQQTERTGAAPRPTGPLSKIDYSERIPNNVNLADDRRLQRVERVRGDVGAQSEGRLHRVVPVRTLDHLEAVAAVGTGRRDAVLYAEIA